MLKSANSRGGAQAFHQRLVGEEEEKADEAAGQEHRDDARIEPAQAFALVQPDIDEDGAQAIEGHAGIVRLVQQFPDGRIRGQMALEQDEIDEHDEPIASPYIPDRRPPARRRN